MLNGYEHWGALNDEALKRTLHSAYDAMKKAKSKGNTELFEVEFNRARALQDIAHVRKIKI